jgi:hypothetical protein
MTPENEKLIYETTLDFIEGLAKTIFEPLQDMTDWPGGQAKAMRGLAMACSPQMHRQSFRRLFEKLEDLIDGRISGTISKAMEDEVERFLNALVALRSAATELADFHEPYAGFGGTVRLALETGTRPWNILAAIARLHPYQVKRSELDARQQRAFEGFCEAYGAFLPAIESAISKCAGKYVCLRDIYETMVKPNSTPPKG